jgi:hypothetical protein
MRPRAVWRGLDPRIHVAPSGIAFAANTWMAESSTAMPSKKIPRKSAANQ